MSTTRRSPTDLARAEGPPLHASASHWLQRASVLAATGMALVACGVEAPYDGIDDSEASSTDMQNPGDSLATPTRIDNGVNSPPADGDTAAAADTNTGDTAAADALAGTDIAGDATSSQSSSTDTATSNDATGAGQANTTADDTQAMEPASGNDTNQANPPDVEQPAQNNGAQQPAMNAGNQAGMDTTNQQPAQNDPPDTNTGDTTQPSAGGNAAGYEVGGTCYPACQQGSATDEDGDGWGYENDESCIVPGSSPSQGAASCGGTDTGNTDTGNTDTGNTDTGATTPVNNGNNSGTGDGQCPQSLQCPASVSDCGCYNVPNLGQRKAEILNAGGTSLTLAAAMMETENLGTDYAYGDNKTGDSFNAGIAKQNWGMARVCHSAWNNLGPNDYATSAAMNSDLSLDIQVFDECNAYYGDKWMAGHRNGASGLANPNTADIQRFVEAEEWTKRMIEDGHTTDNVRFWANVPAIIIQ